MGYGLELAADGGDYAVGLGGDVAGGAEGVVEPVGVFAHTQHVGEVEEHDFAAEAQTGGDEVGGVVVGGFGQLVGGGLQAVAGAEGEPLRDVDLGAHAHGVGSAVFGFNCLILYNIIVVVGVELGHSVILIFVFGGDEGALGDEEGGVHVEFQRGGQREGVRVFIAVVQLRGAVVERIGKLGDQFAIEVILDGPIVGRRVEGGANAHEVSGLVDGADFEVDTCSGVPLGGVERVAVDAVEVVEVGGAFLVGDVFFEVEEREAEGGADEEFVAVVAADGELHLVDGAATHHEGRLVDVVTAVESVVVALVAGQRVDEEAVPSQGGISGEVSEVGAVGMGRDSITYRAVDLRVGAEGLVEVRDAVVAETELPFLPPVVETDVAG